jgi:formylglycine-generating enzyme required for sulfatase activity/precorrin-6B methylase 2
MWPIVMGIEHEKIHLETSSVLHRQLNIDFIKRDTVWSKNECQTQDKAPQNDLIEVKGTLVTLGKKMDSNLYGWDLEYGNYEEKIDDFKASKFLVSNGEFLEFIEDGGYFNEEYWSYEGKNWKNYKKVTLPTFWSKKNNVYYYRTLTQIIELPLNWPVDVNYLEAEAFCNWKSKKMNKNITLPTEAQWHAFREYCDINDDFGWEEYSNINLEHFSSSCEVNRFEFKHGFYDVVGNVWQWTKTPVAPFEGFKIHPIYDDFSVPTFDTRHNLFMGGSWISMGNEATKYARYAFRRHFYQHAGFRYIEDFGKNRGQVQGPAPTFSKIYISPQVSFGIIEVLEGITKKSDRILNLGCNHGELIFKIRETLNNKIIGIDFTARNILVAQKELDELGLNNIEFWQGDACNLKPHFKDYNIIIATNNYQELYDFDKFLNILNDRLLGGGFLILDLLDFNGSLDKLNENFTKIQEINGVTLWKKN